MSETKPPRMLKVNGLDIELPYVKRTYGGLGVSTEYGDVLVTIAGTDYTLRIGEREWYAAESKFKVKGVDKVVDKANESVENTVDFYIIALTRHHGEELKKKDGLTRDKVSDLMDWKPAEEGQPTLRDALERCLTFTRPAKFPDEEIDPKALQAALLLIAEKATKELEAKTS